MKREKTVFKVELRYITYHSHIIKTDQSIQAFRETLLEKGDKPMRKRWIKRFAVVALATAVSVYTVPKTGLLAALGLSQTSDAVLDGQTITSTGTDENAVNVSEGANVTVKNSTVSRESSDSTGGDNSSFYGVGSALLCTNGVLNVVKDTITTNAAGGAGVFAYGDGTANVADTTNFPEMHREQ